MKTFWPKTMPILVGANMQTGTMGYLYCRCWAGWMFRCHMIEKDFMAADNHPFGQDLVAEAKKRGSCSFGASVSHHNDHGGFTLDELADIWNTCVRKRKYVETNEDF